jgi:hypothetical protein
MMMSAFDDLFLIEESDVREWLHANLEYDEDEEAWYGIHNLDRNNDWAEFRVEETGHGFFLLARHLNIDPFFFTDVTDLLRLLDTTDWCALIDQNRAEFCEWLDANFSREEEEDGEVVWYGRKASGAEEDPSHPLFPVHVRVKQDGSGFVVERQEHAVLLDQVKLFFVGLPELFDFLKSTADQLDHLLSLKREAIRWLDANCTEVVVSAQYWTGQFAPPEDEDEPSFATLAYEVQLIEGGGDDDDGGQLFHAMTPCGSFAFSRVAELIHGLESHYARLKLEETYRHYESDEEEKLLDGNWNSYLEVLYHQHHSSRPARLEE